MRYTLDRVMKGLQWRADKLISSLPPRWRVALTNQMVVARALRGRDNFDRARLAHTYREAWRRILRDEPGESVGDFLEFGVFYGSSLACMHQVLRELRLDRVRMFGFDSFEGFPESAAHEDNGLWLPGGCKSSLPLTRTYLRRVGVPEDAVTLIKGWFSETATPETAARHGIRKASVIMMDCDLYSSTRDALAFCEPLIHERAVIVFDDWNAGNLAEQNLGQRRAMDELLAAHPDLRVDALPGLNYKNKADPHIVLVTRGRAA
jgi:O-methyltransferase